MIRLSDVLKPVFKVNLPTTPCDPSKPPTTGEEYIQRVVMEAANCEEVTVADIDGRKFDYKQTPAFENPPECIQAPAHLTPSIEWQQKQVANFSDVRRKLARVKALETPPFTQVKLPDRGIRQHWIKFCFDITEEELENDELLIEADKGAPPLVSTIVSMNQPTVEQVLDYHLSWLQGRTHITTQQGRWLYALLAALELPLTPDMCFQVRTLARECARMRAALATEGNPDMEKVTPLNLFICLVALYFRQADLADT